MKMRGVSFPEAIEELAQRFSVTLRYEKGGVKRLDATSRTDVFKVNEAALKYFMSVVRRKDFPVLGYLTERGIATPAIQAYSIGASTRERDELRRALHTQGFSDDLLLKSGIVRRSESGELYDNFRARVIFPILLDNKHIAGFGGRIVPALVDKATLDRAPKYLNSPETPVYQKQKILFGVPQAVQAIRATGSVYLVEGYMDVVGLWQAGIKNVVATCGTAVTEQHARRLRHLTKRVVLLFDGDAAGRSAAGKIFPIFINSGLDVECCFLPDGEDPDTFCLAQGAESADALRALPHAPLGECYLDYLAQQIAGVAVPELGAAAKGRICEELSKVLSKVTNLIEKEALVESSSAKLRVPSELLREMVMPSERGGKSLASTTSSAKGPEEVATLRSDIHTLPPVDREILRLVMATRERFVEELLQDPELVPELRTITVRFLRRFMEVLRQGGEAEETKERVKGLLDEFGPSWLAYWKEAYTMRELAANTVTEVIVQCRQALKREKLTRAMHQIDAELKRTSSHELAVELSQEKLLLGRQLNEM